MSEELNEEQGFNLSDTLSRTELFVENNKKNLSIGLGVIALVVGGYFAFKWLIINPQEKDAQGQLFVAEKYFEQDSLKKAINGDGNYLGFKGIIDEYGMTKSANLAHYYLGMSYLKNGQYQEAIEELKDYSAKDEITGPLALGAIGDAYMELNQTEDAVSYYKKAADKDDNKLTSPMFLMKAAQVLDSENKTEEALDIYKKIKTQYFDSNEGRDIEKYIARAETILKK